MILCIDIGNSNIVIALYKDNTWTQTFRYETKEAQPEFFYENALRNILLEWGIQSSIIKNCVVSSVVPDLNESIRLAVSKVIGYKPLFINHDLYKILDIHIPHPFEIGSDIVSNAYGAMNLYDDKCIIVDFGTALTFIVTSKNTGIQGVTIAPGLKTAMMSLSSNTAQLPVVPLELPDSAIGKDTVSAIQAGVMWGYVGLVSQLLEKIKSELTDDYKVIATGGLSSILAPLILQFDFVDKMLTLEGMRLLFKFYNNKTKAI